MSTGFNPKFTLREQKFHDDSHRDENMFYNEGFGKPDQLQSHLTYLFGMGKRKFSLSTMLEGDYTGDSSKVKIIKTYQYDYPIMGRREKVSTVVRTNSGSNLGIGHSEFTIVLDDARIKKFQIMQSSRGIQARVQKDPVKVEGGYEYTCVLNAVPATSTIPASEVTSGAKWIALYTATSIERSRGSESNTVTYGKVTNQVGIVRKSMSWGDAANLDRVMDIEYVTEKGKENKWMSWFMYQFEMDWLEEHEHAMWYSRYNRDADSGKITLIDAFTNEFVPTGEGLLGQISNVDQYSKLTYNKLTNSIADAFYGHSDMEGMSITLHTGMGGKREFHKAMMEAGAVFLQDYSGVADKFVKGEGYNLTLQGYFDSFYHIDGYFIKVRLNPLFDEGRVATVAPKHPETGWSLESYRMVFVYDGMVDGTPNLQKVALNSAGYAHSVQLGHTDAPRELRGGASSIYGTTPPVVSSEINEGAYYRSQSCGIQMINPNLSFHLECIKGL